MTQSVVVSEGNPEPNFATFGERLVAIGVDVVVLTMVFLSSIVAIRVLGGGGGDVVGWVAATALPPIYYVVAHARFGQTIGKRLLRIQVQAADGFGVGWRRAFRRESPWIAFAIADLAFVIPGIVGNGWPSRLSVGYVAFATIFFARLVLALGGALTILATKRRRALHDFLAGTIVTRR